MEAKLEYERVRREDLEAQLDEYRAETSHLNLQIEELSCALRQTEGVSFVFLIWLKLSETMTKWSLVW